MNAQRIILLLVALIGFAAPAVADTIIAAPSSDTTVAFGNALTVVLTLCIPPVAAILAGALWKLAAKWGFQATAQDKANTEAELQTALAFGVSKAGPLIAAKGWDHADVHSEIVADAARYFLERFPDRAATIQSAANTTADALSSTKTEAVSETLAARLPEAVTIAAASPATPPVPPPAPQIVVMPAQPPPASRA
jgi:hypothetical protein